MLNPSVIRDSGKVSVRRSAFFQTCNLLSQYMKEKKATVDRSFEMARNIDGRCSNNASRPTTMNLFPMNERVEEVPSSMNGKSLLPQHAGVTPVKPNSSEPQSAPMTIFYAGQVIVINDFPAYKAKEIMELASRGMFQHLNTTTPLVTINDDDNDNSNDHPVTKSAVDSMTMVPPCLSAFSTSFSNNHQMQEPAQKSSAPVTNDLPIARKASLHRFLEKRKDRITSRAPYSATSKPGDMQANSKPKENNAWLGLAAAGLPSPQP